MKLGSGFKHGMIGRRALASGGCENQNAGDLGCHLPQILETLSGFENVGGCGVVYRYGAHCCAKEAIQNAHVFHCLRGASTACSMACAAADAEHVLAGGPESRPDLDISRRN